VLNRFERPDPDFHLDARAEEVQNRHQPISREACEVGVADPREVGRGEACSGMGGAHAQFVAVERLKISEARSAFNCSTSALMPCFDFFRNVWITQISFAICAA